MHPGLDINAPGEVRGLPLELKSAVAELSLSVVRDYLGGGDWRGSPSLGPKVRCHVCADRVTLSILFLLLPAVPGTSI